MYDLNNSSRDDKIIINITKPTIDKYVNRQNQSNFNLTGTCAGVEKDTSIVITATGGISQIVHCQSDESWSSSINLSSISDGEIIISANLLESTKFNTETFSISMIKSTILPTITPNIISMATGNSKVFVGSGTEGPYSFSLLNGMGKVTENGLYSAPSLPSGDIIQIQDKFGNTAQASVTVIQNVVLNQNLVSLITGESFLFSAQGGFPDYVYSNITSNYLDESTHIYQAPLNIGPTEDQIRVSDSQGNYSTSQIKIRAFETKLQLQAGTSAYQTRPQEMAQDSLGNLYVIGFERDSSNMSHWVVEKSSDQGNSWTVISNLVFSYGAMANAILVDSSDKIYVLGVVYDKIGRHLLLQKSTDHGDNWTQNENFNVGLSTSVNGMAIDSSKNLYVTTSEWFKNGNYQQHWIVRKISNDGAIWTIVDDYQYVGGGSASANSISIDDSGNIYAAGYAEDVANNGYFRWIVRKSTNGGITWTTKDDFLIPSNSRVAMPRAIAVLGTGTVYIAGVADDNYNYYWLVRKSTNGGTTWTTVLNTISGNRSELLAMSIDSVGNLYAVGYETDPIYEHWVVKKSVDAGNTWSTIQDFSTSGNHAEATAILITTSGTIYVAGWIGISGTERWVVQKSLNYGNTWITVRDFSFVTGTNSFLSAMTFNSLGQMYLVGTEVDNNKLSHWKIKKSLDGGSTFMTVNDFNYNVGENSTGVSLITDTNGNIYSIGTGRDSVNGSFHWLTRKSTDNGNTWIIADDYLLDIYADAQPSGIYINETGTIFVVGSGYDGSWNNHWVVRKSNDGGATWSTVRNFQLENNNDAQANAVIGDIFGNVYVAGHAWDTSRTKSHWLIQKTADGGASWTSIHNFQYDSGGISEPLSIHVDPARNILVSGSGTDTNSTSHWLILKSSNFGLNWTVMSDFNYSNGQDSVAKIITSDNKGSLYVGGEGVEAKALRSHSLIRKSDDGGTTWVTIDDFVLDNGKGIKGSINSLSPCFNFQICAAGNIHDILNSPRWMVRVLSQ